jgi:hypothetical protein
MVLTDCVFRLAQSEGYMQFSKAPIAANFGDLQRGEIPEPLKFNRPFRKFLSGGALLARLRTQVTAQALECFAQF